jgi:hypothetical protein
MQLGFNSKFDDEDIDGVILHTKHEEFEQFNFDNYPRALAFIDGRSASSDIKLFQTPRELD